ncbi:MAG: F0F1 ATP synthase subunit A [Patescibacteria group bacterium]
MSNGIHISVKAEEILNILGFSITNSLIFSWLVMIIFLIIGIYYSRNIKRKKKSGVFYVLHMFFMYMHDLIESVLHDKVTYFYPLLGAYFFYILLNNWMGIMPTVGSVLIKPINAVSEQLVVNNDLRTENAKDLIDSKHEQSENIENELTSVEEHNEKIPLFRSNNADLNATVALALITVFFVQFYGFKFNGFAYLKKFFNFTSPVMAFVGILELISEFARILSFAFRLFGNILAGEILITIVAALLPPVTSFILIPFFTLEIMAGAIQALVFTMISTVLIGMATQKVQH